MGLTWAKGWLDYLQLLIALNMTAVETGQKLAAQISLSGLIRGARFTKDATVLNKVRLIR